MATQETEITVSNVKDLEKIIIKFANNQQGTLPNIIIELGGFNK